MRTQQQNPPSSPPPRLRSPPLPFPIMSFPHALEVKKLPFNLERFPPIHSSRVDVSWKLTLGCLEVTTTTAEGEAAVTPTMPAIPPLLASLYAELGAGTVGRVTFLSIHTDADAPGSSEAAEGETVVSGDMDDAALVQLTTQPPPAAFLGNSHVFFVTEMVRKMIGELSPMLDSMVLVGRDVHSRCFFGVSRRDLAKGPDAEVRVFAVDPSQTPVQPVQVADTLEEFVAECCLGLGLPEAGIHRPSRERENEASDDEDSADDTPPQTFTPLPAARGAVPA